MYHMHSSSHRLAREIALKPQLHTLDVEHSLTVSLDAHSSYRIRRERAIYQWTGF